MSKAHEENISNLFDFQAEDNIDSVSNNEKPAITKRFCSTLELRQGLD